MIRNKVKVGNSVATPRFADAYKLHRLLFRHVYPFPLDIKFNKHTISVKIDKLLQFKHIPFFINLITITTLIGFGTCAFLPLYKLFRRSSSVDAIAIVICLFLGSCSFLEFATYIVFCIAREVEPLVNQLFEIERHCKFPINY